MDKLCGVYFLKNKINGKVYIGCSKDIKHRLKTHKSSSRIKEGHLYSDIREYGWDSFENGIVEICDENILYEKEIFYIKKYNSTNPDVGYNKTHGGKHCTASEELRKKLIVNKTELQGRAIVSVNIDSKDINKYPSLRGYCRDNNKDQSVILDALQNRRPTAYGCVWFYEDEYYENFDLKEYMKSSKKVKKICMFDMNWNFIKEYNTAQEACVDGFDSSAIIKCCKGVYKHHRNYKWKYKIDCI